MYPSNESKKVSKNDSEALTRFNNNNHSNAFTGTPDHHNVYSKNQGDREAKEKSQQQANLSLHQQTLQPQPLIVHKHIFDNPKPNPNPLLRSNP